MSNTLSTRDVEAVQNHIASLPASLLRFLKWIASLLASLLRFLESIASLPASLPGFSNQSLRFPLRFLVTQINCFASRFASWSKKLTASLHASRFPLNLKKLMMCQYIYTLINYHSLKPSETLIKVISQGLGIVLYVCCTCLPAIK